jgi:putative solute:sodium symporter small subunit
MDEAEKTKDQSNASNYWHANLKVVGVLMSVWFITGYVLSIFFIESLNTIKIGQMGLGFWFAQQGSIIVFVVVVLVYALLMDAIDRRFNLGEGE